jgi:hypothetical protein
MQYLFRLKVFLLCCLLVIVTNVMLIMGGFVTACYTAVIPGLRTADISATGQNHKLSMSTPAGSRCLMAGCDYGFCVEKR